MDVSAEFALLWILVIVAVAVARTYALEVLDS